MALAALSDRHAAPSLPFPAIVGHAWAKTALLLLAVDPALGGVLISAAPGTGKSTLARSFHALLPGGAPLVHLPLNASIDRVAGGLDLDASLAHGARIAARGVLAEANGGVLVIEEINLLDAGLANLVMEALSTGRVRIEREGISREDAAAFALIATYDPAEGAVRPHLADRIGLIVAPTETPTAFDRAEIVRRAEILRREPAAAIAAYQRETDALIAEIAAARERLPRVWLDDECATALAETAAACAVPGNRADVFAARAACAAAALDGREVVTEDDLRLAVRLVLLPRATHLPQPEAETEPPPPPDPPSPDPSPDDDTTDSPDDPGDGSEERSESEQEPAETPAGIPPVEDLILAALAGVTIPEDVLALNMGRPSRRAASGSRGATESRQRGRVVGTVIGEARGGHVSVPATLLAAVPHQRERGRDAAGRLLLSLEDVRLTRYREKAGTLFIFCVDASGSMALNRMRAAKGAVTTLLGQAYVHRDRVALIAFRGERAEILLPPSQGVERAKRALDVLPTGGGTPLAAALYGAHRMATQAQSSGVTNVLLVCITDGRANVPLISETPEDGATRRARANREAHALARRWHIAGWGATVIDTQVSYTSRGEAATLAKSLGGRYLFLPGAKAGDIAAVVTAAANETRQA